MTSILRKFQNETLIKNHLFAFVGFMAGLKLCDYLLFDDVRIFLIRNTFKN